MPEARELRLTPVDASAFFTHPSASWVNRNLTLLTLADATVDRIINRAHKIALKGPSKRKDASIATQQT